MAQGRRSEPTVMAGASAEQAAVHLLLDHGYEIIERNYRCAIGELDIVARAPSARGRDRQPRAGGRDPGVLVFVEVRSRTHGDHGHAFETVGRRKQRQVARVAAHYLVVRRPDYEEARFDVVAFTGDEVVLLADAWRL